MIRLDDILEAIRAYHADADLDAVRKAYVYSAKVHQGQTRLSGDPYMSHPMEVAFILTRLRMDVPTVVTGLLHDTGNGSSNFALVEGLFSIFSHSG